MKEKLQNQMKNSHVLPSLTSLNHNLRKPIFTVHFQHHHQTLGYAYCDSPLA